MVTSSILRSDSNLRDPLAPRAIALLFPLKSVPEIESALVLESRGGGGAACPFYHGSPIGSRKLLLVELERVRSILLSLLSHVGIAACVKGKTAAALPRRLIPSNCSRSPPASSKTFVFHIANVGSNAAQAAAAFAAAAVSPAAFAPAVCISIAGMGAVAVTAALTVPAGGIDKSNNLQKVGQQEDSGWTSSTSNRFHEPAALPCTVLLHIL